MNIRAMCGAAFLAAAIGLAGCTTTAGETAVADVPRQAAEQNDAGKLAVALAVADRAFAAGNDDDLRAALMRIGVVGWQLHPEQTAGNPVAEWQARVPSAAPPTRGRALGPAYRSGAIAPGGMERLQQLFLSGQKAQIAVEASSGGRLQLAVFDAEGKSVCDAKKSVDRCEWIPIFTQRYRIEIRNPKQIKTRYYLVID